jgi:hypothetical protein
MILGDGILGRLVVCRCLAALLHKGDSGEILLSLAAIFFAQPTLLGQSTANPEGYHAILHATNACICIGKAGES